MTAAAEAYAELLAPWAAAAGVVLGSPRYEDDSFAAKVDQLVAAAPSLVSFAFGWPPAEAVARLQSAGVQVWVTLNEPAEVEWAEALGVDGIVAQGWEAGGHNYGGLPTFVQVPQMRDALPDALLLASGGIVDGRGVAAALALGADGVWIGTRLLASPEANVHPEHHRRPNEEDDDGKGACEHGRAPSRDQACSITMP